MENGIKGIIIHTEDFHRIFSFRNSSFSVTIKNIKTVRSASIMFTLTINARIMDKNPKLANLTDLLAIYPFQKKYIPNKLKNNPRTSACILVLSNNMLQNTEMIKDAINPVSLL